MFFPQQCQTTDTQQCQTTDTDTSLHTKIDIPIYTEVLLHYTYKLLILTQSNFFSITHQICYFLHAVPN